MGLGVSSRGVLDTLILVLIALPLTGCTAEDDCLTVSEVWQNAESLAGEQVCVRGQADLQLLPYHPLQVGGCSPDEELVERSHIVGRLELHDGEPSSSTHRLTISDSDLQCEGDVCSLVCKPFAPTCEGTFCGPEGPITIEAFEFVGTLQVGDHPGSSGPLLEGLDLEASRRLVNGEWEPIPIGEFTYVFP